MNSACLFMAILAFSLPCQAGKVYKWQDDHGKWHFSDTAPGDRPAEVEETDPASVNSAETGKATRELQKVFPGETPEEAAFEKRKAASDRLRQAQKDAWCSQARKRLETIRGRVVFLDDEGNAMDVTEEEREARADALAKHINANCH